MTISVLERALNAAHVDRSERVKAFRRLAKLGEAPPQAAAASRS